SPQEGTTRDYLVQHLEIDGVMVELVDTAGWRSGNGAIEEQAQELGRDQAEQADLILFCQEAGSELPAEENELLSRGDPPVLHLGTKCDAGESLTGGLTTSAVTGMGLAQLRKTLAAR